MAATAIGITAGNTSTDVECTVENTEAWNRRIKLHVRSNALQEVLKLKINQRNMTTM